MTPAARIQAAIDILDDVLGQPLRFDDFFRNWAREHRYAGSKDRRVIKELVFHVFRHFGELAWRLPEVNSRALVMSYLVWCDGKSISELDDLFENSKYGPSVATETERQVLSAEPPGEIPIWAELNVPEWLLPQLKRQLGDSLAEEVQAMNDRAPLYLRVNTLKATPDGVIAALSESQISAETVEGVPLALRLPSDTRVQELDAFKNGGFEIQDLGSQIVGALSETSAGETVVDLAAGAGGKTLQLAAMMKNRGRLLACDIDRQRLDRLERRAKRAGVSCVETICLEGGGQKELLERMTGAADVVLIDAPCSGSGTWRRRPEARWWLTPEQLCEFKKTQQELLELGAQLVRPGGRLIYVTCSILPEENQDQMAAFDSAHGNFGSVQPDAVGGLAKYAESAQDGVQLTPLRHNTDGFFVKILNRLDDVS